MDAIDPKTPAIYMLVGPPASGKSTWRAQHMAATPRPTIIISSDDYIDALAATLETTYAEAFKQADMKEIERVIRNQFEEAIKRGDNIIVDRTNMRVKSRRKFLSSVPKTYRKIAVVFSVSRDLLDRRLADRAAATGKNIPKDVVDGMIKSYEEPTSSEFNRIERV
jgi:predicted kinase